MKVTIVGCGDAWGSGGRSHTCFRLDTSRGTVVVDFGASAIVGWHRLGLDINDINVIFLSHLHGDHFAGLPFLLLQSQFETGRKRPLLIVGPPGSRERIDLVLEAMFPGIAEQGWHFPLKVQEIEPGWRGEIGGILVRTANVIHPSGAPATALRLTDGISTFAYSGDTAWTDALLPIAKGADLYITECYSAEAKIPGHISWTVLKTQLPRLGARRIAVTHMGVEALAITREMERAGLSVCHDGAVFEL